MNTRTAIVVPTGVGALAAELRPVPRIVIQSSVACTLAGAWMGDRFRIPLDDRDAAAGAARRWDGAAFADGPEDVTQRSVAEFELRREAFA